MTLHQRARLDGGVFWPSGARRVAHLVVKNGDHEEVTPLERDVIRLGRSAENDLVIDDPGSSRYHCRVERRDDDGWELVDNDSRNGTLVNGRRQRRRALSAGDRIEIGSTVIVYQPDDPGRETRDLSTVVNVPPVDALDDALDDDEPTDDRPAARVVEAARPSRSGRPRRADGRSKTRASRRGSPRAAPTEERPGFDPSEETDPAPSGRVPRRKDRGEREEPTSDVAAERSRESARRAETDARPGSPDESTVSISAPDVAAAQASGASAPTTAPGSDDALHRVMDICKALSGELDPRKLLERIMDAAIDLSGAERGFLILEEREPGRDDGGSRKRELRIKISRNIDREEVQRPDHKFSRTITRQVIESGEAILTADATADHRFGERHSVQKMRLRSVLSVPLRARKRVIGAVYVDNRFEKGVFTPPQRELLEAVAGQAAVALENARLFQENVKRATELERANEEVERLNAFLRDENARQRSELEAVEALVAERRQEVQLRHDYGSIITRSSKMLTILSLVDKVTDSSAPVIIQGESGTGKELVARAVHFNGPRRGKAFVSENCAAIPSSLMESELFGHVKGAFTGAVRDKKGLIEAADGGTLFLDEIGDMDIDCQTKLLRVLQAGEVRRVGSKEWNRVDVRVISATNRDLRQMIREGTFREDLFYRLNVIGVVLPPLRERREDIPLLVDHFLEKVSDREGGELPAMSPDVLELLIRHTWPGNIRELENEIERACTLASETVLPEHLSPAVVAAGVSRSGDDLPIDGGDRPSNAEVLERLGRFEDGKFQRRETLKDLVQEGVEEVERRVIVEVLRKTRWTKSRAANVLGVSRPTLDAKIDKYALKKEEVLGGEV